MSWFANRFRTLDSPDKDAFGRLRTSQQQVIFNNKQLYGKEIHSFEEDTSGGSSTVIYRSNESSSRLTAGTGATDYAIRQTKKYMPYTPGHSQRITMTFNLIETPDANCSKRVGYFDDDDGIYLEQTSSAINVVRRTSTSGSPVDEPIPQASWNVDIMDGTGPSGITVDLTKTQILFIDFQWLGVGRVRVGFNIDGEDQVAHEFLFANTATIVYMKTPNLPVRWEVRNSSGAASTNILDAICCSVEAEGGVDFGGHEYSVANGSASVTVGTSRTPVLAVRQKPTYSGKANRRVAFVNNFSFFVETKNCYLEAVQYQDSTIITAGPGWTDLDVDHSSLQYQVPTTIVSADEHRFWNGYAEGANKISSAIPGNIDIRTHHTEMLVNKAGDDCETIIFFATADAVSAAVRVAVNCIESY